MAVMSGSDLILGSVLMALGVAFMAASVVRALRGVWHLGLYEIWALPTAGAAILLLGRWLIA